MIGLLRCKIHIFDVYVDLANFQPHHFCDRPCDLLLDGAADLPDVHVLIQYYVQVGINFSVFDHHPDAFSAMTALEDLIYLGLLVHMADALDIQGGQTGDA